jgi:tetratricopeptide (TPR) repeat protein
MNTAIDKSEASKYGRFFRESFPLLVLLVAATVGVVSLARWMDARRPAPDPSLEEENLYFTGRAVHRVSLGFNGLIADWYWMRSLQYVGRKVMNLPENVALDSLDQLKLKQLAQLLDTATTLDPEFMEPYEYAAMVLPGVDLQEAIRITKKGAAANPGAWRLYQYLGFIYWRQRDFQAASEAYGKGATLPGAPIWMGQMKARMAAEGGSRNLAREIYGRMYNEATDKQVKDTARRRLLQIDSMDERDALRAFMAAYNSKSGHCPASWRDIESLLRAAKWKVDSTGAPLDPAGTPYLLVKDKCDVDLDWKSEVPSR